MSIIDWKSLQSSNFISHLKQKHRNIPTNERDESLLLKTGK